MKDALRHLDQRFEAFKPLKAGARPPKGWVRAIRDALGMTGSQLAKRLGVAQPRISEIEQAEVSGSLTLKSLEATAEALGCRVIYALVPYESLTKMVEDEAERRARKQLTQVEQTMKLENQEVVEFAAHQRAFKAMKKFYLDKPSRLWGEE